MIRFTKWMLAPALAACLLLAGDSPSAQAQGISLSFGGSSCGGYGAGYGGGYGGSHYTARPAYRSSYGHGYSSRYRSSYMPSYRSPRFHDTSHYDYYPTEIRRHGNHYDVIPGHYGLHRTGHFHH